MENPFEYPFLSIPYLWCRYRIRLWTSIEEKGAGIENNLANIEFYHDELEAHLHLFKDSQWGSYTLFTPSRLITHPELKPVPSWLKLPWPEKMSFSLSSTFDRLKEPIDYERIIEKAREEAKNDPIWQAAFKAWKADRIARVANKGNKRRAQTEISNIFLPRINKALDPSLVQTLKGLYQDTLKLFEGCLKALEGPFGDAFGQMMEEYVEGFDAFKKANKFADERMEGLENIEKLPPHSLAKTFIFSRFPEANRQILK